MPNEKPFWQSKKWLMAVAGVLLPILNSVAGLDIDIQQMQTLMAPMVAYIVGQGIADFGKNKG